LLRKRMEALKEKDFETKGPRALALTTDRNGSR
jgi:hypothetical protein